MFDPIKIYRLSHFLHNNNFPLAARIFRNFNFFLFKTYLPPSCKIGTGVLLGYKGVGTILHSNSSIGKNCLIGQGVTLGTAVPYVTTHMLNGPSVGDNTFIGSGAKLLGDIAIGSNCTIAAGAIVLKSIPDNSIVVGIPGRIIGVNGVDYLAIIN